MNRSQIDGVVIGKRLESIAVAKAVMLTTIAARIKCVDVLPKRRRYSDPPCVECSHANPERERAAAQLFDQKP
jgi:hypothetical protein